jgi:hypothetical protein
MVVGELISPNIGALPGSRRRSALRSASGTTWSVFGSRSDRVARLWRFVVERDAPNEWTRHARPRPPLPPPRDRLRFLRPEGPSTGKRALTNSRPTHGVAVEGRSWRSVTRAPMRARARPGAHVQPQPNASTSIRTPPVGICKQTEARARPANVRTSHTAAPFQRRSAARRLRAVKHLEILENPG